MGSCATGTCEKSKSAGGPGCYMCDVVARGKVAYRNGKNIVTMDSRHRMSGASDVRASEKRLTKKQANK